MFHLYIKTYCNNTKKEVFTVKKKGGVAVCISKYCYYIQDKRRRRFDKKVIEYKTGKSIRLR
jgi:hypothetical protein